MILRKEITFAKKKKKLEKKELLKKRKKRSLKKITFEKREDLKNKYTLKIISVKTG